MGISGFGFWVFRCWVLGFWESGVQVGIQGLGCMDVGGGFRLRHPVSRAQASRFRALGPRVADAILS